MVITVRESPSSLSASKSITAATTSDVASTAATATQQRCAARVRRTGGVIIYVLHSSPDARLNHPPKPSIPLSGRPATNKLGLALLAPNVEVEVTQQRVQYGIGVLHNKVLRRGIDPSLVVDSPPTAAAAGTCVFFLGWGR